MHRGCRQIKLIEGVYGQSCLNVLERLRTVDRRLTRQEWQIDCNEKGPKKPGSHEVLGHIAMMSHRYISNVSWDWVLPYHAFKEVQVHGKFADIINRSPHVRRDSAILDAGERRLGLVCIPETDAIGDGVDDFVRLAGVPSKGFHGEPRELDGIRMLADH